MNCTACGAPIEAGAEKCPYCGVMTPYGEKVFAERKEHERQEEQRRKSENAPCMAYASWLFVPAVYVLTFGYYAPYWYVSRAASLNKLYSETKMNLLLPVIYAVMCVAFFFLPSSFAALGLTDEQGTLIFGVLMFAVPIMSMVLALRVRRILQEHAGRYIERSEVIRKIAPSGIMLFLFGPAYLQYSVNRMIAMKILAPKL